MHIETRKRKSGLRYKFHVKVQGHLKTRTFSRKYDGIKWAETFKQQLKEGVRLVLPFKQLAEEWHAHHSQLRNAPATHMTYKTQLGEINAVIGDVPVQEMTYSHLERVRAALAKKQGRSNTTINRYIGTIRTVLNYGVRKGDIVRSPFKRELLLPTHDVPMKSWSKEDAERFMAYADKKYAHKNQFVALIYKIALNTGMRWGEVIALKWDAINWSQEKLTVCRTYCTKSLSIRETTKGRHIRYIWMNEVLLHALKQAFQRNQDKSELVIYNSAGGTPDNQNFVKRRFLKDIQEAEVPRIRFHDLRHTYSSLFMMSQGSLYDLQKILGHQNISTTERYAHLANDYLKKQASRVVIGQRDNVIEAKFGTQPAA